MSFGIELMERGLIPESLVRMGIRAICRERIVEQTGTPEQESARLQAFIEQVKREPIAVLTEKANEQHYELPPEFFTAVLGKHRKYSSCFYQTGTETLDQAEADMLALSAARAEIVDGHSILELGCGWGSMTLWLASQFPRSSIVGVSNSKPQRDFILAEAAKRGLSNVEIITADMNSFSIERQFDRIVSIEMFEHMRNYERLMQRVAGWLKPGGALFVHIFTHHRFAYFYEAEGSTNWMGRYFFSGGTMPSDDLLFYFQQGLMIDKHWRNSGMHYSHTANAWARNMEERRAEMMPILERTYGAKDARRWFYRWKAFFLACAELFGYNQGREWLVSHYLFKKPSA
ncbi:MAG: class I SAM-dependent methyltransferase [Proteobacteria bacterium]|nr:class I SAM-dependent methyltransferase [Pseudomonadota bacterium]